MNGLARISEAARGLIRPLAAICALALLAAAAPAPRHVTADLVSARAAIAPGERFTIALRERIQPGWHTYWRNPGDSGLPTSVTWRLPSGAAAGDLGWPAPEIIKTDSLVTYGYEGEVLLPVEIAAPAAARGTLALRGHATWLVCANVCVPEEADLALDIPIAAHGRDDPQWAARLAAARASIPRPADVAARVTQDGKTWRLELSGGALAPALAAHALRAPVFLPFDGAVIDHAAAQRPRVSDRAIALTLTPARAHAPPTAASLQGLIEYEVKRGGAWTRAAVQIAPTPIAAPAATPGAALGLAAALAFAFLGGLILNAMPCVFPVLSIKALSLARDADEREARRHGLLFTAGVMATFLSLAGALIALQAGGAAIGWGFQLQEPLVVGVLALLFFAIALNQLGVFEIGASTQNFGAGLAARGGAFGAFFTGALAVAAATPCTAPFMGAALGFAATQPAPIALGVFAALGLGFALPFFALSAIPPLRRRLPKPGRWMETFRQLMAFPMFAAAIWLIWVLARQRGADGALFALAAFLGLGLLVWSLKTFRAGARWAAAVLALLLLIGSGAALARLRAPPPPRYASAEAWSPAREAALRAAGKPVFVDFTAAWCVTCQVNDRIALRSARVSAAFAQKGVTLLVADWTSRDAAIAKALKAHGREGVPLYLFYPGGAPGAEPKVLPQILTPAVVLRALGVAEP